MTNITPIQRHLTVIRDHLDGPACPARNAALMLACALRDPHLPADTRNRIIAENLTHPAAQQIERMVDLRGRG